MLTRFTTRTTPVPPCAPRQSHRRPVVCAYAPNAPVSPVSHRLEPPEADAPSVLRLPLPPSFLDVGHDAEQASTSAASNSTSKRVARLTLTGEQVSCVVTAAGEFFLLRNKAGSRGRESIAGHGSVTLPSGAAEEIFCVTRQLFDGDKVLEAEVTWGPPSRPLAMLRILCSSVAASKFSWCTVSSLQSNIHQSAYIYIYPDMSR